MFYRNEICENLKKSTNISETEKHQPPQFWFSSGRNTMDHHSAQEGDGFCVRDKGVLV